jgi:hypothetical protein
MFYIPSGCGACELAIENITDYVFGDQLVPCVVSPRVLSPDRDKAVTMYLCKNCISKVQRHPMFSVIFAQQYRVVLTLVPKQRQKKSAFQYGNELHEAQNYAAQAKAAANMSTQQIENLLGIHLNDHQRKMYEALHQVQFDPSHKRKP